MPGKCQFKEEWSALKEPEKIQIWLRKVDNNKHFAKCTFCNAEFSIAGSGISQVKVHASTKKHIDKVKAYNTNRLTFTVAQTSTSSASSQSSAPTQSPLPVELPISTQSPSSTSTPNLFYLKNDVIRAEIIWCLHRTMSHQSLRSSGNAVELFKLMFPDSGIAGKMQLQKDKIGYLCTFGLGPYFQGELTKELKRTNLFSVSFDESLNTVAQKTQMDIHVRFWNVTSNRVQTRYLTSNFLGKFLFFNILVTY